MFTADQIKFMIDRHFGIDFSKPLDDNALNQIEDKAADVLQYDGFDKEYEPTAAGTMAESIIDALT